MRFLPALAILSLGGAVLAQSSTSYRIDESTLNAGGHPGGGLHLHSDGYRMSLDAVGDAVAATPLAGTAYSMDVGFPVRYPPPRDVRQVVFLGDKQTLTWAPDRSAGTYAVYRGTTKWLPGDAGACMASDLADRQAVVAALPETGRAFFYLVTAESTLSEQGPPGYDSTGALRPSPAQCP